MTSLPIISSEDNRCGTCTACCTVLGVKEIRKPQYVACAMLCETGCSIYNDRPSGCKSYECLWRVSTLHADLRPDKVGVILEPTDTAIGLAVVVREVWKGAAEELMAQQIIGIVAEKLQAFIYIFRPDNTRGLVFPPWAEHLRPLAKRITDKSWEDVEREQRVVASNAKHRVRDEKRQQRKLERVNRKRNRR